MDRKIVLLGVFFVLSYFLLVVFSSVSEVLHSIFANVPVINAVTNNFLPVRSFDFSAFPWKADYMLLLLPVCGFFFVYFLIDWINAYFDTKLALSFWLPALFFVLCLLGFYVQLVFYFGNISFLNGGQPIPFDLFGEFRGSPFFQFTLAGILGWASRKAVDLIPAD